MTRRGTPARAVLAGGLNRCMFDTPPAVGYVAPDAVPHAPPAPSGKVLVAVSTRVARPSPLLEAAAGVRYFAARDFAELAGITYEDDRSRIFGALLAHRVAISSMATAAMGDRDTTDQLAAFVVELTEAIRWARAARAVTTSDVTAAAGAHRPPPTGSSAPRAVASPSPEAEAYAYRAAVGLVPMLEQSIAAGAAAVEHQLPDGFALERAKNLANGLTHEIADAFDAGRASREPTT